MNLMVLDDAPDVLSVLKAALERQGGLVRTFEDGAAALAAIEKSNDRFDCILVDIQMPGIDGIEFVQAVRSREDYRDTPILMITAMSQLSYLDRAFAAGATDYITKPFDIPRLRARIGQVRRRLALVDCDDTDSSLVPLQNRVGPVNAQLRSQSVEIGRSHVLNPQQFENLLIRTAELDNGRISMFAVRLLDWDRLTTALSPDSVSSLLACISAELEKWAQQAGGFITYRGDGVFLVVERVGPRDNLEGIEACVLQAVAESFPGKRPRLVFGARETASLRDQSDALLLLQSVLSSLSRNERAKRVVTMPSRRMFANFMKSALQRSYERMSYNQALEELLHSEDSVPPLMDLLGRKRRRPAD